MHLFNLACIAATFIITFCYVSADYNQEFYKQMRVKAKNCVEGTAIEVSNMCYACICVSAGVIKCDPSQCPVGPQANEEGGNDANEDALESEDPEQAVEEEDPEQEPAAQADEPDDKSSVYKQLRVKAKNCVEGTAIEVSNMCYACICVSAGVIKCDPSQCPVGPQANEEGGNDANEDALQSEDPEPAVEEADPEPEPAAQADEPDDKSSVYKQLRELALNCTTGPKSWKDPDSPCNICTCLANGVVVCTRVKCYPIHKPDEPEPNLDKSDELEQNLDNPDELEESLEPVPEAEPEPEVEPETEVLNDDANDVSVYKKLRSGGGVGRDHVQQQVVARAAGAARGADIPT
ncbi:hypothetical protein MSG28_009353 [Choristoneura fumiferana]|uniref:Uncharacterized protein n=1 Tax=Choristoneura fumiferana TaxID=7141 RepID=A0ACC0KXK9_CHOFU|nr:hypothetical protein MSG28_009353 [Choristoneura fumiferana]